jgi:CRP-like cAMP-binding protein
MTTTSLSTLQQHPFLAGFQPGHIERIRSLAREVHFDADHIIFREGDECSDFYLIVSGLVALEIELPRRTIRLQTLVAGDEFGWSAVLMGRGKHFQARTLRPVEALALDGPALVAACEQDPSFGFALMYRLLGVVSERLQATRLELSDNYSPVAKMAGA